MATEETSTKLNPGEAGELRAETSRLLKQKQPPNTPSITKEEYRAIKQLRKDQSRIVLTADKGVAMVIMDRQQYMDKATTLLQDTNTCRTIPKDPTNKLKNKLIGILRDIKQTGGLKDTTYHKVYPTSKFAHSVQQGVNHLWGGQGAGKHHMSTSRSVTTSS